MKLKDYKHLKLEILNLPQKEKDKILLRLIARDKILTEQLHYSLLENKTDLLDRIHTIKEKINHSCTDLMKLNYSYHDMLLILRSLLRLINHFNKITKAHFEDIELRIYMLNTLPINAPKKITYSKKNDELTFLTLFVKTIKATINKIYKLHEDLQFDIKEDMNMLLKKVHTNHNLTTIANEFQLQKSI